MAAVADEPDYYELLGVARTATTAEIKAAYRSISKTAHPDAGGNEGLFRLVSIAYKTLIDPPQRAAYDTDHLATMLTQGRSAS